MKNDDVKTELDVTEEEKKILIDHHYDGIQELNHPLPNWWNGILYLSIAFAVVYFAYYQFFGGPTLTEEFNKDYAKVLVAQNAFKAANGKFDPGFYQELVGKDGVKRGSVVYENNCLPCHSDGGRGDVGPNLTDEYWLLAKGTPETIYHVAFNGSEENGMPAWSELLSKEEIYLAVAYVSSLKNTRVKGKEPQGEKLVE